MELSSLCSRYRARFIAAHGKHTTDAQWSALNALAGCHTEQYGMLNLACRDCSGQAIRYRSCGHRFCNQCQLQGFLVEDHPISPVGDHLKWVTGGAEGDDSYA